MTDQELIYSYVTNSDHSAFEEFFTKYKVLFIALLVPIGLAVFTGLFYLAGIFVQWLWAVTISDIFAVKEISFWQAIGLIVLCKILFGNTFS
ncbi:MAG: hypothetical protein PF638_06165, partial [Candidatus Delongbacteria bacterium]|nr:hypothetical protein [Candidatus Delongbacteria bacterium]